MADISVTAASVKPANAQTGTDKANAAVAITAGQTIYVLAAGTAGLCDNDDTADTTKAVVKGIALNDAEIGQPCTYAKTGDVTFNAVLTAGEFYMTSSAAGGIRPQSDAATTDDKPGLVGFATTTTNMTLMIKPTGVTVV